VPAVLLFVPCDVYELVLHALLSVSEGSLALPTPKLALAPPTSVTVPLPIHGRTVPVLELVSGRKLLKFHSAMMSALVHVSAITNTASIIKAGLFTDVVQVIFPSSVGLESGKQFRCKIIYPYLDGSDSF
jgi:hypothetical protein